MKHIVIGCGRIGSGLARQLDAAGHDVAVVDVDADAFGRLGPAFRGVTEIGSGLDRPVLERAGIRHVDGLASVTGNDEVNAVVARLASRVYRVPKVVARLHDPRKAEIYRRLGVQVVAPVDWSVHRTVELLTFAEANVVASLGSGQVDLVDAVAPALLAGRPVTEVTAPGEVVPVAISRAGRTFIPSPATTIEIGDIVHLAVLGASHGRLESLLGSR
ncbi:MAG: TrkA family potassium uptake protein [Ilumatobacteraceae bacterium]|jgi:trk system potassium uptake protein TrkA|nr:TrkA family potassium uptake protein [Ilumatobacteraceae bacterium]